MFRRTSGAPTSPPTARLCTYGVGGHGPAVVLLLGFGDTGDMWAAVAAALEVNQTVIVSDLRGKGLSARPDDGYTKKNQATDIAGVMDALQRQDGRSRHP
jgi:pimeloyl-ACP methyl ester carboxylesterase